MRQDAEFFGDAEIELIHVSRRLREAKEVEKLLESHGVDYLVEPGRYQARALFFFPTERIGAFFYVLGERAAECRVLLAENRYQVIEADE